MIQRNKSVNQNRIVEITETEQKNKDSLRDLQDDIKYTNISITGVPEGEEREKGAKNIFEDITAENFPNLGKETDYLGPGSTKTPKQDQLKEDHTKTHCN